MLETIGRKLSFKRLLKMRRGPEILKLMPSCVSGSVDLEKYLPESEIDEAYTKFDFDAFLKRSACFYIYITSHLNDVRNKMVQNHQVTSPALCGA